jgi:uncharacterized protein
MDMLKNIGVQTWLLAGEMAPYLLLGFAFAGVLRVLVRPSLVMRHFGKPGFWQTFKASVIGVPMPLCSCGVIPVAASFRRQGAGKGATTAFLAATPQLGVDSVVATWGLLGPLFTGIRVALAFISGMVTGLLVDRLDPSDEPAEPEEQSTAEPATKSKRIRDMLHYGFVSLPGDIGRALIIGLLIAGVISALMPDGQLGAWVGDGFLSLVLVTLVAVPMYVCSTGSIPVAIALMQAGLTPGVAMVFLITGPATNAATVSMLWNLMGWRTACIYLASIVAVAWLSGWGLDQWFPSDAWVDLPCHDHVSMSKHVWAAGLSLLLGHALWRRWKK